MATFWERALVGNGLERDLDQPTHIIRHPLLCPLLFLLMPAEVIVPKGQIDNRRLEWFKSP